MTYPLVQFVSAPEVGATVRFDFNASLGVDVESFPEHEGFSLGAPEMVGNPGEYGTSWGDRELTLTAFIEGERSAAYAAQTTLARELWRRENWLLFQLDATSAPRWFKTYRSQPGALSFEFVDNDSDTDLWGIPVTLTAEGGIYGPREEIGPVTINNDPAAATNPMSYVLPAVKGDVPAPLRVEATTQLTYHRVMLSLVSAESSSTIGAPVVYNIGTSDGWSANTDTSAAVADSAYSGGSYRAVTFATDPTLAGRLFRTIPIPSPGSWRALARIGSSDTTSMFTLRMSADYSDGAEVGTPQTTAGQVGPLATWVDLGILQLPANVRDTEATPKDVLMTLYASRVSGSGSLYLDTISLVPVETADTIQTRTLFSFAQTSQASQKHRWDADEEYYQLYSGGLTTPFDAEAGAGHFPAVAPDARNVLTLFRQVDPPLLYDGSTDSISSTASVSMSYHPRYLWIGA